MLDLIRQFYDETRSFRITNDTGANEYIQFNNQMMQGQMIPPAYPGQELEPGYEPAQRMPVFDIVIKPQRRSPYSKLAQNELAKELYQLGFFNPQLAEQSMTALDLMDFDGEEKVRDKVQQGQTLLNQMQMMQQQMTKLGFLVYKLTGQDVLGMGMSQPMEQPMPNAPKGGSGIRNPQTENLTYGERLAKRATPDVSEQV